MTLGLGALLPWDFFPMCSIAPLIRLCTSSSSACSMPIPIWRRQPARVHAVIKSDLDVLMLQLKRNGATTAADYPPVSELVTSERIDKVGGADEPCGA